MRTVSAIPLLVPFPHWSCVYARDMLEKLKLCHNDVASTIQQYAWRIVFMVVLVFACFLVNLSILPTAAHAAERTPTYDCAYACYGQNMWAMPNHGATTT